MRDIVWQERGKNVESVEHECGSVRHERGKSVASDELRDKHEAQVMLFFLPSVLVLEAVEQGRWFRNLWDKSVTRRCGIFRINFNNQFKNFIDQ